MKNQPIKEARHARLGPSGFKPVEICPSYVNTPGDSEASRVGTRQHKLMEKYGVNVTREREFALLASDEQMEALQTIADYVKPIEKALEGKARTKRHTELELDLTSYAIPDCEFGTADLVWEDQGEQHVELFDYKFGWMEVEDVESNVQLWLYALGCFARFKWARSVRAHILQPACDVVSTHTFTRQDIPRMLLRAMTIAERKKAMAGKEFVPVTSNCLWCGNKASCLALHGFALKVVKQLEFPTVVLTPEEFNDQAFAGDAYNLSKLLERWAKDIRWKITQLALDGLEIPGKILRQVKGKARIIDTFRAWELLHETYSLSLEEFMATTEPSITKIESAIAAPEPRGFKGQKKDEVRQALMGEGIVVSGAPSAFLVDINEPAPIE